MDDRSTSGEREAQPPSQTSAPRKQSFGNEGRNRGDEGTSRGRTSILNDDPFNRHYAYGAAEGVTEPWSLAPAVLRDFGALVFGKSGRTSAKPRSDESQYSHATCSEIKARLKKQAEERLQDEQQEKPVPEEKLAGTGKGASFAAVDTIPEETQAMEKLTCLPNKLVDANESSTSGKQEEKAKGASTGHDRPEGISRESLATSSATGDIVTSGTGHYEPNNDVILRLETMTAAEARFLSITLFACLFVAVVFLMFQFVYKITNDNTLARSYHAEIINAVFSGILLVSLTAAAVWQGLRVHQTIRHKKVWKPRRKKYCLYVAIELLVQWVNVVFYLLPNVESFRPPCFHIFSNTQVGLYALVRWTCWNTLFLMALVHAHNANIMPAEKALMKSGSRSLNRRKGLQLEQQRTDVSVIDMPFWKVHWPKICYWLLTEASVLLATLYYVIKVGTASPDSPQKLAIARETNCEKRTMLECGTTNASLGIVSIMITFVVLYFVWYCYYIWKALVQLRSRSSVEYKLANVIVRLQMRLRLPAFGLFTLSVLLLFYVKPFSCNSMINTWFGMLPGQISITVSVLLLLFVGTPNRSTGQKPILQVWLQEFAWTESEKASKMESRNRSLPKDQRHQIEKEPMFCVETMMHCLYWSLLAYDFNELEDSKLTMEEACGLFNPPLTEFEVCRDKATETKLLLAWNRERMILAFRGTANLANVLQDLQAWRRVHKPQRGSWWSRPRVHNGFDKAWRNNNFNKKVTDRIKEIILSEGTDSLKMKYIITGHSLGGALATLAAYDLGAIVKELGCDAPVSCYTFGAPRTGNRAFAKDFEETIPDCWHIINDQDVVARRAKFVAMYKRGGHRVLINPRGDLIVRPNPMEAAIRLIPLVPGSVNQHLLTSYLRSLLEVLLSQFTNKNIRGGMAGVVQLAKENTALKRLLLEESGKTTDDLMKLSRWGAYAPKVTTITGQNMTLRKPTSGNSGRKLSFCFEEETTRGGTCFGCCASSLKIWGNQEEPELKEANVADDEDGQSTDDEQEMESRRHLAL